MEEEKLFNIAFESNRKDTTCENKQLTWEEFKELFKETERTSETVEEYKNMTQEEQVKIKDVGGFICGYIKDNKRNKENVVNRSMITLDMDHKPFNVWDTITLFFDYKCLMYSTHKHTPEEPRLRLIIPLDRDVEPEEYEPISRAIAKEIDDSMEIFDNTTYEFSRLMFSPSTPCDGEYVFEYQDGKLLKADEILNSYTFGWDNPEYWPRGKSEVSKRMKKTGDKVQDPTTKTGYIGAFCRAYTIHEAIETFLSDVYEPGSKEDRYKYTKSDSADGLEVFDEGLTAYSYQESDKVSGKGSVNSFDLVRLHLFGDLDSEEDLLNLESKDLKSFKAMCEFVCKDKKANAELIKEEFEKVDKTESNYKKTKIRDIEFLPLAESLSIAPIKEYKFLVNRLLYDNAINLISGDPKTYKTYVAIDIALGVITGGETIGHKVLEKGKVLVISTEFDVRPRFIDLLKSRGIDDISILNNIITFGERGLDTFQWNKDLYKLRETIKKHRPKLLILDPLTYIFDGDINKGDEVGEFFKELKVLIRKYDISVLIIHHNNRMSENKRMNNVSGSSAITRFVDSIIYLERFKEDEEQDINKTDEELDEEIKPIKLIKGRYRHGKEGYKYYTVNFKITKDLSIISAERLDIKKDFSEGEREFNPEQRKSDIENKILNSIYDGKLNRESFNFNDVKAAINNIYKIADRSFTNDIREVLKNIVSNGSLEKIGHTYIYKGM
ncbi:AAA family ATPase [Clostridium sp.]|uniref:AAA family ATPase n=1 Tax=Clostridium sp. TaxID=1506 RepID=UPI0025C24842|nr:AAA family ATPase [Clostridium sp.]